MSGNLLVRDDCHGEVEDTDPSLEALLESIALLDGTARTLVTLYRNGGPGHLAVGGSATSGLVLYVTFDNSEFWQLNSAERGVGDSVHVVAGGQRGLFPARQVVSLPSAAAAASFYFREGVLDPDAVWERQ